MKKNLADEIKENPKSFWNYVRSKTKARQGVSDLKRDDGTFAHTDPEKAKELNNFFASVFTRESDAGIPEPELKYHGTKLEAIVITEEEVLKKLKKLNPTKSQGPDCLHPRVLKEVAEVIAKPLASLFNKSLLEGTVPEEWKIAEVTAIFKKGSTTSAGNYRPVSLTSVICKVLESIIRDQVMEFLNDNNLLSEDQHGFRSGRSCVIQLLEIMELWTEMLDEGGGIDVVYLDFRKAFDSVPHQRLLKKARAHGLDGNLINGLAASYLEGDRESKSVVEFLPGQMSLVAYLKAVCWGPILFVIFINDLPDVVEICVKVFADDTKVFTHVQSDDDCTSLQRDLEKLSTWSDTWQLKFNVSKCGVMHYGRQPSFYTYSMSEEGIRRDLEVLEEEKDLGVRFDPSLQFSKHVAMVSN